MSKRPTKLSKKECSDSTNSSNSYGYAIIGDTATATLYAKRLLGNGVTTCINIINEGVSRVNVDDVLDGDFVMNNNKVALHYLHTERIHMLPAGDHECEDDDDTSNQTDQIIQYHVPTGPLGDYIASYHIPRLGPWFNHSTNTRMQKFFTESTVKSSLNSQEVTVANIIKGTWNLHSTNSIIVKGPSILNCHHTFVQESGDTTSREIFMDNYQLVNQAHNTNYITEANNMKFTEVSNNTYDINGNNVSLEDVKVVWKTNLYTYLRLATVGELHPAPMQIPVFYRATLTIPETNPHVDLSGLSDMGDLVTTHLTFSLQDIHNSKSSSLVWLVQCYTAIEDLSIIEPSGRYADTGKTLLFVEAICTKNRRQASYDISDKEIQLKYNDSSVEQGYLEQFAQITAVINNAYTNGHMTADDLIQDASICTSSGTCQDANSVVDYSLRQSPLTTIIETASQLYGLNIYPSIPKC